MFSFSGDTVLDPFAGSGTTALAAVQLGRHSISVDVEPALIAASVKRLQAETDLAIDIEQLPSEVGVSGAEERAA